ncbi:hypothetical protein TNCV_580231 [Trichonephila clavipes]|nr:hypothetical protein TNCV_580231 [Trichonephila clavipes]
MSSNTRCSGLSRQRGVFNVSNGQRVLQSSLPENVWDALGRQVAGRNYPPINKNFPSVHSEIKEDKLPQQLLDNVVQNSLAVTFNQSYAAFIVILIRNKTANRRRIHLPEAATN